MAPQIPKISIHAPAWGATRRKTQKALLLPHFNPRARVGRDASDRGSRRQIQNFNPRARVGRDPARGFLPQKAHHFNPRARVGRDAAGGFFLPFVRISIHAPAWGATCNARYTTKSGEISIHAPAWGATIRAYENRIKALISIHAPAWGATVPVYTGLITAVALYFSRTSFCPCCYRHFSPQSPLCDTGSHRDFAAILAKEMPATASEFLQLHNLILHRRAAFFLRIYCPSYKNAGCLFLGQSNLSTHAAGRRTVLHREHIRTRNSARAVRDARSTSPLSSGVYVQRVFLY